MTERERSIRYVTLRMDNWHLMTDLTINLLDQDYQEEESVEFFFEMSSNSRRVSQQII